jgi:hypothetical protein
MINRHSYGILVCGSNLKKEKAMGDTHGFVINKKYASGGYGKASTLKIRASRGCTKIVGILRFIFFDLQVF